MPVTLKTLKEQTERERRIRWFREARFGLFIHWGLYSQLGGGGWDMNRERIPASEYEPLADRWHPKPGAAREWARLARQAGMRYAVLTSKHHEGFCLWDTAQTDYNAVRRGPRRDLVREFVDACRAEGLRVGLYYSLMDWHHPDGVLCLHDEKARRRFLDFTSGCVRELMSNYGRIDILWYDMACPLDTPEKWESAKLNAMVRSLQPDILINDRSQLPEDFGTPEGHVTAPEAGRHWESCITVNDTWGYCPTSALDRKSPRQIVRLLQQATQGAGNLLLNVGPAPNGTVAPGEANILRTVGRWVAQYGEAMFGPVDRVTSLEWMDAGRWTQKGKQAYFWAHRYPGSEIALGGFQTRLKRAVLLPGARPLPFKQEKDRIILRGLPPCNPDPVVGIPVIRLEFASRPVQQLGNCCTIP